MSFVLGKKNPYYSTYRPDLLCAIPRKPKRIEIGVPHPLPFFGFDLWNHYEVSWLNEKGKPMIGVAEMIYGCDSPCIIESKSMKLYFNSLNNTPFDTIDTVMQTIKKDIEKRIEAAVFIKITPLHLLYQHDKFNSFDGICLDHLDIENFTYSIHPTFLTTEEVVVEEVLYSDLLKSNCLVTHQPDWGSIQISYKGKKINHEGLLRYIVSFRNHNEFHEQCIERIWMDIMQQCQPEELIVYGRYTRRGGIDINPYRSSKRIEPSAMVNQRLCRQ